MSKPVFDPDRPAATRREWDKPQLYCQDGHLFSMRHDYVGPDPFYTPPKEPVEEMMEASREHRSRSEAPEP